MINSVLRRESFFMKMNTKIQDTLAKKWLPVEELFAYDENVHLG
jgi:hypothetical protein